MGFTLPARRRRTIAVALALLAVPLAHVALSDQEPAQAATTALAPSGLSCDNATAQTLAGCISRLLSDPGSPYSPDHTFTAAERTPVRGPASTAATAATLGSWQVVADLKTPDGQKVNAVHVSLTKLGKVLITAGSGFNRAAFASKVFRTYVWDPRTRVLTTVADIPDDLFCAGHMHLQDGSVVFFGGTSRYGEANGLYYAGIRTIYKFDDATNKYVYLGTTGASRWYPNAIANAAGDPVVVAGLDENSVATDLNETYSASTGTTSKLIGRRQFPLYPNMHLLAGGGMFYSGANTFGRIGAQPGIWNWYTNAFTPVPGLQHPQCRDQASSVVMYPAQAQRVMVIGGGCSTIVTNGTAIATLTGTAPSFVNGPTLPWPAMYTCALNLPDRSVFVSGGGNHNANPTLQAAVLRQGATAWSRMASPTVPRMYHGACLLMPDGSVMTFGSNVGEDVETRVEQYKPWYLQPGVVRPVITQAPATMGLGGGYQVSYTGPSRITDAHLTRLGSITHSSDPNQRSVQLKVERAVSGGVVLRVESRWGVLPLGPYLLTLVDSRGVPSASKVVRVVPAPAVPYGCGHCCGGC